MTAPLCLIVNPVAGGGDGLIGAVGDVLRGTDGVMGLLPGGRALAHWRTVTFTIAVDGGRPRTVSGYTIAAANSRSYGGGMQITPAADRDDGQLAVVIIHELPRTRFLTLMPTVFAGTHTNQSVVEIVHARVIAPAASPEPAPWNGAPSTSDVATGPR